MHTNKLLLMAGLHFVVMFFLMYTMIATFDHFYVNINKIYMAAIMTAPMLVIEALMMKEMYKDKKAVNLIALLSVVIFVLIFSFIRNQTGIYDKSFLRSMIPHHSSAILMCNKAKLEDPEIKDLCVEIIEAQKEEISEMESILNRLN